MEKKQNILKPKGMGRSWNYKLSLKWNKKQKQPINEHSQDVWKPQTFLKAN